jgi:RHS repeat-associated protein
MQVKITPTRLHLLFLWSLLLVTLNATSADLKNAGSEDTNTAPTANAGFDQTIDISKPYFILYGSANDPDGDVLTYSWAKTSGPSVTTSGSFSSMLTLTNISAGTYVFTLTVSDGVASSSDVVVVTAASITNNHSFVQEDVVNKAGYTTVGAVSVLDMPNKSTKTIYYDDQGRMEQVVSYKSSPGQHDAVVGFEYDNLGREINSYLPVVNNSSDKNFKNNLLKSSGAYLNSVHDQFYKGLIFPSIVTGETAFAVTKYEPSPMNRVIESGGFGNDLQPGGHTNTATYSYNSGTEVMQMKVSGSGLGATVSFSDQYVPMNTLNVQSTTDADGLVTKEYVNSKGQLILHRIQDGTQPGGWANTYYVYDDSGNLIFVIPPVLAQLILTQTSASQPTASINGTFFTSDVTLSLPGNPANAQYTYWGEGTQVTIPSGYDLTPGFWIRPMVGAGNSSGISSTNLQLYAYQNVYDQFKRLIASKAPGADWSYFVYDKANHMVLSQNGNQRTANKWFFVKYDRYDRPVLKGEMVISGSIDQIRQDVYSHAAVYEDRGSVVFEYTNNAYPSASDPQLYHAVCYYDDIQTVSGAYTDYFSDVVYFSDLTSAVIQEMQNTANNKGLLAHSKIRILGTDQWLNTSYFYDRYYRNVFTSLKESGPDVNAINRNIKVVNVYDDFTSKILKRNITCQTAQDFAGIVKEFSYDHAGRLKEEYYTAAQNGLQQRIHVASYTYNELGQLILKKLHSTDDTNWLQSLDFKYDIQNSLTSLNDLVGNNADDAFGFDLAFNKDAGTSNTKRYNGLASAFRWNDDKTLREHAYNFTYDNQNRLTDGTYKAGTSGAYASVDRFSEKGIAYDANGNIQSLTRYQDDTVTPVDALAYNYGSSGNQLMNVSDANNTSAKGFVNGSNSDNDYGYDANGNLLYDKNKNITAITYNSLNLPEQVTFNIGGVISTITYQYDASGKKVRQIYTENNQPVKVDYIGEFIAVNGKFQTIVTEQGRITASSNINLISNEEAVSLQGFTANGNVTLSCASLNNQNYVKAVCNQNGNNADGSSPGVWPIGGSFSVKAGEQYALKIKGYTSTSQSAYLYVKGGTSTVIVAATTMLPNGSANEAEMVASFIIPVGVTQISVGVLWSSPAQTGATLYINKVYLSKQDLEHQYFITDHLGSTRVVLGTSPATMTYTATFETENLITDMQQFSNIVPGKIHIPVNLSANATPGGNEVIYMDNTYPIGPARSFKVFPGDKIDASVNAYFDQMSNLTAAGQSVMEQALLMAMTGGVTGVVDGGIHTAFTNSANNLTNFSLEKYQGSTSPSAFINYILFDDKYVPIEAKSTPVGAIYGTRQLISLPQINVSQLGYLYVYLSYDNNSALPVMFDDFKITYTEGPVIQVNAYYPYGATAYTWLRDGEQENKFLFQSKEYDKLTGLHDFQARQYDAILGRWIAADPASQYANPYTGMGNMPTMGTDPDGEWFILDDAVASLVGGVANALGNTDRIHNFKDFARYFGAGAAGGEASLYLGPYAGFAIAGGLNVVADNANSNEEDRIHGWNWKSFVRGGLSALGADEAGLKFADVAGYTVTEEMESGFIRGGLLEETLKATKIGRTYDKLDDIRIGGKIIKGGAKEMLSEGIKNALSMYANSEDEFSFKDGVKSFGIGLLKKRVELRFGDVEGFFANMAKAVGVEYAASISTSIAFNEDMNVKEIMLESGSEYFKYLTMRSGGLKASQMRNFNTKRAFGVKYKFLEAR